MPHPPHMTMAITHDYGYHANLIDGHGRRRRRVDGEIQRHRRRENEGGKEHHEQTDRGDGELRVVERLERRVIVEEVPGEREFASNRSRIEYKHTRICENRRGSRKREILSVAIKSRLGFNQDSHFDKPTQCE